LLRAYPIDQNDFSGRTEKTKKEVHPNHAMYKASGAPGVVVAYGVPKPRSDNQKGPRKISKFDQE